MLKHGMKLEIYVNMREITAAIAGKNFCDKNECLV